MSRLLFEDPFLLSITLLPLLLVSWGVWSRAPSKLAGRVLLGVLVLAGLLFAMQAWVLTDREKLQDTTRRLSEWAEQGQIGRIVSLVAPGARFEDQYDRDDFEAHVVYLLEKYDVSNHKLSAFEIELHDGKAEVYCRARCTVRTREWTASVPSRWWLEFELISGQWLITDLRPLEIAGQTYHSFWGIR